MSWLSRVFRRKRHERSLDAELRFHLETQIAENIAAGLSPVEARRQATIAFGGAEQIKEECRDVRSGQWWETTLQDVRCGFRSLCRSPGYAIAALAMIALGVGANTAIFSFIDAVLLKPLPYPDSGRIVAIVEKPPEGGWSPISTLNYLDWASQNTVFETMAVQTMNEVSLGGIDAPVHLYELRVSAKYFDVFRITPALGRTFLEEEDEPNREAVAILTNKLWRSQFGADDEVIGRKIILDGIPTTVVGVMPPGFLDRNWEQIYRPLVFAPDQMSRDTRWFIPVYAMLKEGVTIEQARAQMESIGQTIAADHPSSNKDWGVNIIPLAETIVSDELATSLLVLMGAVGMVLLMACVNLANLTLARGIVRRREVAIRAALGAGRWRLFRQFLTESLLLSFSGGVLGLLVGYSSIAILKKTPPGGGLPSTAVVEMDLRILLFALGLSLLTGIVFGLVPAFRASRSDLNPTMKDGTAGAGYGRGSQWLRRSLVVTEVALAFVVLSGAGLLIRSFFQIQKVDTGFDSTHLTTAYLPIDDKRFSSTTELMIYLRQILERIGSLPGVSDVALTTAPPINWGWGSDVPFHVLGKEAPEIAHRPHCGLKVVSASYFRTLGMTLKEGRFLNEHDLKGSPTVTVISESMASKYFPEGSAVGRHILALQRGMTPAVVGPEISWEVVGVVRDERNVGLRDENKPGMYVTLEQSPTVWQFLMVRGAISPGVLERSMRAALREVRGDQVMDNLVTLDWVKSNALASDRRRSWMLGIFAGVALILAAIGLYGLISYSAAQRTREIGIRTALGATPKNILGLVLRDGMALTAVGLLFGLGGAISLSQIIASLLFNVGKYDPPTLAAVGLTLGLTSFLSCILPARRAAKVNPIIALRCE